MNPVETNTQTYNDRIKLPFHFDVEKMKADVQAFELDSFNYYNVIPLRSPAHTVDPSLPFPSPTEDYADGSWCDWLDTSYLTNSHYLLSIVDFFRQHTTVTLVRILRLASGSMVKEHTDPTLGLEISKSVIRLTIPILQEEGVVFYLNQQPVQMKTGECWYLRLTDPHKIVNNSHSERINLTIDMIPNEWIREIINKVS